MKKKKFTNFQRKKTAEWLLNISQATIVAVLIGLFVPDVGAQLGLAGVLLAFIFSITVYALAMQISKEVKNG